MYSTQNSAVQALPLPLPAPFTIAALLGMAHHFTAESVVARRLEVEAWLDTHPEHASYREQIVKVSEMERPRAWTQLMGFTPMLFVLDEAAEEREREEQRRALWRKEMEFQPSIWRHYAPVGTLRDYLRRWGSE